MTGYHVSTPKKLKRYEATGAILPPVRFWPDKYTARRWMKRTGRTLLLEIEVERSYPLPDHKPAKWSDQMVRNWKIIDNE